MKQSELALSPKLFQQSVVKFLYSSNFNPQYPWVVELDPTTACNLACPDCISGTLLGQGGFSSQRFLGIVDELIEAGIRAVVLIGGGEPMMHIAIGEAIEKFGKAGVDIGITTNGLFLEKYRNVISEYVSWTRISVDAASDDLYKIVRPDHRGESKLQDVFKNIESLTQTNSLKGIVGYSYCFLPLHGEATYHGYTTNCDEIYLAARQAKRLGCSYFELKPSFDQNHFHINHPSKDVKNASEQFARAKIELEDENFSIYGATNLGDILEQNANTQPKDYTKCSMLSVRTLITPHGVYPCPYFRGDSSKSYGDLSIQSFQELWDSKQKKDIVQNLNPCNDCRFHCIRHQSNLAIDKMQGVEIDNINTVKDFNRFI